MKNITEVIEATIGSTIVSNRTGNKMIVTEVDVNQGFIKGYYNLSGETLQNTIRQSDLTSLLFGGYSLI